MAADGVCQFLAILPQWVASISCDLKIETGVGPLETVKFSPERWAELGQARRHLGSTTNIRADFPFWRPRIRRVTKARPDKYLQIPKDTREEVETNPPPFYVTIATRLTSKVGIASRLESFEYITSAYADREPLAPAQSPERQEGREMVGDFFLGFTGLYPRDPLGTLPP